MYGQFYAGYPACEPFDQAYSCLPIACIRLRLVVGGTNSLG